MNEELIRLLSDKLDVSTEFIYEAMYRQVYVARITDAVGVILMFIIMYGCYRGGLWCWKKGWNDDIPYPFFSFLLWGAIVVGFLTLSASAESIIAAWVNPNGWILLRLLSEMKS